MAVTAQQRDTGGRGDRRKVLRWVGRLAGISLLALTVSTELRKPPELRTWHGVVLGFVPYDLRRPTLQRVRDALWAPEDHRLFLPRAYGIGWSPNLGRLARWVRNGFRARLPLD